MAYPRARSCNQEMERGMVEGTYRTIIRDRGGDVEMNTALARADLSGHLYGIVESGEQELPDCKRVRTAYTIPMDYPEGR